MGMTAHSHPSIPVVRSRPRAVARTSRRRRGASALEIFLRRPGTGRPCLDDVLAYHLIRGSLPMPNPVQSAFRAAAEAGVGLLAACNRLRLPGTRNPFVVGVHEPMREELTLENLTVTGTIPAGLDGLYLK